MKRPTSQLKKLLLVDLLGSFLCYVLDHKWEEMALTNQQRGVARFVCLRSKRCKCRRCRHRAWVPDQPAKVAA